MSPSDAGLRKVLIISPKFPPVNAADLHRVRQSLPYFEEMGWETVTLAVDPERVDGYRDEHLLATVPAGARVEYVSAFDPRWTRRLGVGNVALRSLWFYWRAGNRLLERGDIDLVYFSTTAFQVMVLGRLWKRRFGVPYVIDMQDPWRSDHYLDVPPEERPPKFWLAYRMDSALEPIAMEGVGGIVSVSQGYCDVLCERYPNVTADRCEVIPFGGAAIDFDVLDRLDIENTFFSKGDGAINVVYVGRGGHDMRHPASALFHALARGRAERPELFGRVRLHFIGTDYAEAGEGRKTFAPLATEYGVGDYVREYPARVPYFTVLHLLQEADMVVLPGSEDPAYTASKLYPYILSRRPVLAVFNASSSVVDILRATRAGRAVTFRDTSDLEGLAGRVLEEWTEMVERLPYVPDIDWDAFEPYTAREMTRRQATFFDTVLSYERTEAPSR